MSENKKITIVTHDTGYHTDDIFAVATLTILLGEPNIKIIRSRDMEVVEKADYVVDVGRIYDPSKYRFDHHQEEGAGKRENGIPYASFGLVWKEYGEKISGSLEIQKKIDRKLVQPIDAGDNGISIFETKFEGVYPYTIGLYFDAFMPSWKEEDTNIDDVFIQMVSTAVTLLKREIKKEKDKLGATEIVEKIYNETSDKRLIVLDGFYPASEILSKYPEPLYKVYPRPDGKWALKTIRDDGNTFVDRKSLPKSWSGKEGAELEKITGVSDSLFCLRDCFLAITKTKEAALKLAEIALNS